MGSECSHPVYLNARKWIKGKDVWHRNANPLGVSSALFTKGEYVETYPTKCGLNYSTAAETSAWLGGRPCEKCKRSK